MTEQHPGLQEELRASSWELRGALIAGLEALGAETLTPTELTKRLGLDKSLAWKLGQVVQVTEPAGILEFLPGTSAMAILVRAFAKAGADEAVVERIRGAQEVFEAAVARHAGDRATLELVVDSMGGRRRGKLETSRKLAFRGNSGIWGVQAGVRVNTLLLAPSPGDESGEWVDSGLVGGWVDFRRLRPDARWVIFRRRSYSVAGATVRPEVPIDPEAAAESEKAGELMLMNNYCTGSVPELVPTKEGDMTVYELGGGAVGNTGAFSCFFGTVSQRLGKRFASQPDETADFSAQISAPVEMLLFDLLVHRKLEFPTAPTSGVYANLVAAHAGLHARDLLPVEAPVQDCGMGRPAWQSSVVPRYDEIVSDAVRAMGYDAADFRVWRVELEYPPFPSTVVVTLPLIPR